MKTVLQQWFLIILVNSILIANNSKDTQGAMPITVNNIQQYYQKQNIVSQSISLGDSMMDKIIKTYKKPLDEMGYDFDTTIINTTRVLKKAPYNQLSISVYNILNDVMQYVKKYPQESVTKGFVKIETRDKILTYLKYSEFNENIIQALNYVRKCQQKYNGLCSANQYSKILLESKFIDPERALQESLQSMPKSMRGYIASQNQELTSDRLTMMFHSKVKNASEFGKYIEDANSGAINDVFLFSEYTKSFRLKSNVQEIIDGYTPWWLEVRYKKDESFTKKEVKFNNPSDVYKKDSMQNEPKGKQECIKAMKKAWEEIYKQGGAPINAGFIRMEAMVVDYDKCAKFKYAEGKGINELFDVVLKIEKEQGIFFD